MDLVRTMSWRRLLCFAVIATGLFTSGLYAEPTADAYSADAVKAAYLLNFIRFTEWPADAGETDTPLVIGVAGNRELEDYLWKTTDGKLLHGRKVRILRLVVPSDATQCQLIYINPSPSRADAVPVSMEEWLQAVKDKPVLTVSHLNNFLRQGGIINFYTEGKNLHFEISADTAETARLQLSSRLLALARIVRTKPAATVPSR
jgi:hypothetical protein